MVTFKFLLSESSSITLCPRPFSDGCLINIEQLRKHYCTGDSTTHILPNSEIADDFMIGKSFPRYVAKKLSIAKQLGLRVLHQTHHTDIIFLCYHYCLPLFCERTTLKVTIKPPNGNRWVYCCNNCVGICLSFKVFRFSNYVVLIYSDLIWYYSE